MNEREARRTGKGSPRSGWDPEEGGVLTIHPSRERSIQGTWEEVRQRRSTIKENRRKQEGAEGSLVLHHGGRGGRTIEILRGLNDSVVLLQGSSGEKCGDASEGGWVLAAIVAERGS